MTVLLPAGFSDVPFRPFHLMLSDTPLRLGVVTSPQLRPVGRVPLTFTEPEVTGYFVDEAGWCTWSHAVPASVPSVHDPLTFVVFGFVGATLVRGLLKLIDPAVLQLTFTVGFGSDSVMKTWSPVLVVLFDETRT